MPSGHGVYTGNVGFENGKLVRCSLSAQHSNGATQVNTLHYDLIDVGVTLGDENDPQSLADTLWDDLHVPYAALFDSGWSIQPIVVVQEKDPQNPALPRSEWVSGTPTPGTYTTPGDTLPDACTSVAKLSTANIGRRHTGRMFLGGSLREADQNGGVFNSTALARFQAVLDAIPRQPDIAPPLSTAEAHWCVYSRTQRAVDADPYASWITSVTLRSQVRWLRSRQS